MRKDYMIKKLIGTIMHQEFIIWEMKRANSDIQKQNEIIIGAQVMQLMREDEERERKELAAQREAEKKFVSTPQLLTRQKKKKKSIKVRKDAPAPGTSAESPQQRPKATN